MSDPHKAPSKSLLVGLEGLVILPPLKDRAGLSLKVSDYVPYEIMVCPYYVQIMAQQVPKQPESEKQANVANIIQSVWEVPPPQTNNFTQSNSHLRRLLQIYLHGYRPMCRCLGQCCSDLLGAHSADVKRVYISPSSLTVTALDAWSSEQLFVFLFLFGNVL